MELLKYVATLFALAPVSSAIPAGHVLHEKREFNSPWQKRNRVDPDAVIPLRIALNQANLELGERLLLDVSHPDSHNYGKHWTAEQVHDYFSPSEKATKAVLEWLTASGVNESHITRYENKGWLALHLKTSKAEELFATEYYEHGHPRLGSVRIGCEEYHIPNHLSEHVDYITPGVKLSSPLKRRTVQMRGLQTRPLTATPTHDHYIPPAAMELAPVLRGCNMNVTPPCLKALYGIPDANTARPGNKLGVYERGDTFAQADLNLFFSKYAPNVPQGTTPFKHLVDGAIAPVIPGSPQEGGESVVDFSIAYSLIYPQQIILYQVDDQHYTSFTHPVNPPLAGFINTFLDSIDGSYCNYSAFGIKGDSPGIDPKYPDPAKSGYKGKLMCGTYKPTNVISVSFGEAEADLPRNYQKRQCNEWMKLGLQGHTVLVSSGDYGVAGFPGDVSSNGCILDKAGAATIFNPDNLSSCPYITSVGGTQINVDKTVLDRESAFHKTFGGVNASSSGGFSNYFSPPSWQRSAIENYFQIANPPYKYYNNGNIGANGGIYNRNGRGFPDVSANGANFRTFVDSTDSHFFGTSLSAPIWASIINLINEKRLAADKKTVGFISTVLYENPQTLNDIVNGTNPGCGALGFRAAKGWDPITGLGTPNYAKLENLFMSLP